jgi:hypothetical protein
MTYPPLLQVADHERPKHERILREAWLTRRRVRVTLSGRCAVPMIVGRVASVSVTGSTALIDGWTIPVTEVVTIAPANDADANLYADVMHHLREGVRA